MNKQKLKKIKLIYYPYKALKNIAEYFRYSRSLRYIAKNREKVQSKINNKEVLNVIFIVQYIPAWNKLEPIYTKMKEDKRFNPVIVCVPLHIQNHMLTDDSGNDTYAYFTAHGYEAIDALKNDGSWFDIKQLHPDYVFHSRPYNHFMPLPYISDEIVKYALICNVMYGINISKNEQEVCINDNYFHDVYIYFAFDKNEKDYYKQRFHRGCCKGIQRCEPYGAIGVEQMLGFRSQAGKNKKFQKTVLWTPRWSTDPHIGGSNFFNYKDVLIKLAKEHPDIFFIFRPHPLTFDNFIKTGEMTALEVREFKDYCNNKENLHLDESKEYAQTFLNSDIMVTDLSGMIPEYFSLLKPIIYCTSNCNFQYTYYSKEMLSSCYIVNCREELVDIFNKLISDNDDKIKERKKCFDYYHQDVRNSSINILNELAKTE